MNMEAVAYNAAEFKAGRITIDMITKLVEFYQGQHNLMIDGMLGPDTRGKLMPVPAIPVYTTETWRALVHKKAGGYGDPEEFAMKWIEVESGGNPAAVGSVGAFGPDGNPREFGIAQFYNPDDIIRLKLSANNLRAYCKGQTVTRALTDDEMAEQVVGLFELIQLCKHAALGDLKAVGATWSSRDFYRLVKLQHGLPGISHSGLRATMVYYGRAPKTWDEFRQAISHVTLDPGTEKYRAAFPAILNNAEKTGGAV